MTNAFNYMFRDENIKTKAFLLFIFSFISLFFLNMSCYAVNKSFDILYSTLYWITGIVLGLAPLGYSYECIKSLIENKPLPNFNFISNFCLGLKAGFSFLLGFFVFFGLGFSICISIIMLTIIGFGTKPLTISINTTIIMLQIFIYTFYSLAFTYIFAKHGWLTSFLRFNTVTKLIKKDIEQYVLCFLILLFFGTWIFIISFISGFIIEAVWISVLVAIFISVINTYFTFVFAYIVAKSIKNVTIDQ